MTQTSYIPVSLHLRCLWESAKDPHDTPTLRITRSTIVQKKMHKETIVIREDRQTSSSRNLPKISSSSAKSMTPKYDRLTFIEIGLDPSQSSRFSYRAILLSDFLYRFLDLQYDAMYCRFVQRRFKITTPIRKKCLSVPTHVLLVKTFRWCLHIVTRKSSQGQSIVRIAVTLVIHE